MNYSGDTWLILGSSVGAERWYGQAKALADVRCTCNGGITVESEPDWYWLTDPHAIERHLETARAASQRGVRIITSRQSAKAKGELVRLAHTTLDYARRFEQRWRRGEYVNGRTSGCFLVQFAINNGAKRVLLVGMEGYKSRENEVVTDYFDGRDGLASHGDTMHYYVPMMRSIIEQCPDVEFVFYGHPNYDVAAPNVTVVNEQGENRYRDTWIVLGSSPTAKAGLRSARELDGSGAFTTITTNGGIRIMPNPDWFLFHDPLSVMRYRREYRAARRNGTKIIKSLLEGRIQPMGLREVKGDVVLHTGRQVKPDEQPMYQFGKSISPGTSGALCAQFAANNHAKRILLIGMEGYLSQENDIGVETFYGSKGHRRQHERTLTRYGPFMASMCAALPKVKFIWYGVPVYEDCLRGMANVEIIPLEIDMHEDGRAHEYIGRVEDRKDSCRRAAGVGCER